MKMAMDCSHIETIDWSVIVGDKTLANGGHFGDLMTLGRAHLEEAKAYGEITEGDSGQVYSALISTSIKEAIQFFEQRTY